MAFTFAAFCYMLSLVLCAALIFFAIWHVSNPQRGVGGLGSKPGVPACYSLQIPCPGAGDRSPNSEARRRSNAGRALGTLTGGGGILGAQDSAPSPGPSGESGAGEKWLPPHPAYSFLLSSSRARGRGRSASVGPGN
ncbi:Hypothetical predicted protein [Marmota monax]|uniref:Uncharacterized protein n=1 Tax=Marmota monax TaxID=9995 RepID=A0A5E4CT80_MARMO|nr:hypothetical protein GHT09_018631 [Marmota monax]VTJ84359.1 Hypothetical predicted protein [Marmota monax]